MRSVVDRNVGMSPMTVVTDVFQVLGCFRVSVYLRYIVIQEGLCQRKIPVTPAALPQEMPRYAVYRTLGETQGRYGRVRKFSLKYTDQITPLQPISYYKHLYGRH